MRINLDGTVLVDKAFDESGSNATWENCSLRKWLNADFINDAFSTAEQSKIQSTQVPADKNPKFDVDSGNPTTDKVFLLSVLEVEKYFSSAETKELFDVVAGSNVSNPWWLRTSGASGSIFNFSDGLQNCATLITIGGAISYGGNPVGTAKGVRPAMWVSLK